MDADAKVFLDSLLRMVSWMVHDKQIMGLCGESKIANKAETFVTMMSHVKHDNRENNKLILVYCLIFQHIHPTSSTGMNNIEFSIHHLAS